MVLWWLDPSWKEARCPQCGNKIWPEGDPDWGLCYNCFGEKLENERRQTEHEMMYPCDICGKNSAVAGVNGYGVCSEECDRIATEREPKKNES